MFATNYPQTPDRLPPTSVEMEVAILGAILLDPTAIKTVSNILSDSPDLSESPEELFSLDTHKIIYRVCSELASQGKPTDLMTVAVRLHDTKLLDRVGGQVKLANLIDATVHAVNTDLYAERLREYCFQRKTISIGHKIVELGFASYLSPVEISEKVRSLVSEINFPEKSDRLRESRLTSLSHPKLAEIFPPAISNPVGLIAKLFPFPESLAIHELIPIFASLVHPHSTIKTHKTLNREENTVVRSVLVAESSNRKSAIEAIFARPLEALQLEEFKIHEAALKDWEKEKAKWDSLPPERKAESDDPGPKPVPRIFSYSGGTKEGLWEILERQTKGILHTPDEILQVVTSRGEYKHGKGSDTENSLSAFNGRLNTQFRKGRIIQFRDTSCLMGGIQPAVLPNLYANDVSDSRGELARYLPYFFDLQEFPMTEEEPEVDISGLLQSIYRRIDSLPPQQYCLSKEAKRLYLRWHNLCEKKRRLHPCPALRAFIGKLEGYCAKFSMIFHIVWSVCDGAIVPLEVPLIQMQRAIRLAEFYYQQALRLQQATGAVITTDPIKSAILERLSVEGSCTVRNLQSASRLLRSLKAAELYKHFNDLADANPDTIALTTSRKGSLVIALKNPNTNPQFLFSDPLSAVSTSPETLSGWDFPLLTNVSADVSRCQQNKGDRPLKLLTPNAPVLTSADSLVSGGNADGTGDSSYLLTADGGSEKEIEESDRIESDRTSDDQLEGEWSEEVLSTLEYFLNTIDSLDVARIQLPVIKSGSLPDHIKAEVWARIVPEHRARLKEWAEIIQAEGEPVDVRALLDRLDTEAQVEDTSIEEKAENQEAIATGDAIAHKDAPTILLGWADWIIRKVLFYRPVGGGRAEQIALANAVKFRPDGGSSGTSPEGGGDGDGDNQAIEGTESADEPQPMPEVDENSDRTEPTVVNGDTAITLHQPWASLVAQGKKHFETRNWETDYRGKILIHAGKQHLTDVSPELEELAGNDDLPYGAIVAIADLTDCILMTEEFIAQQSDLELLCGVWEVGRYAWKLENIQALSKPIPTRGYQKLWKVRLAEAPGAEIKDDRSDERPAPGAEIKDDRSPGEPITLSGRQLAKRLSVSPGLIPEKKLSKDFGAWSKKLDPDGMGWKFNPEKNKFESEVR